VFILKMPRVRVGDLVEVLVEAYAPQFGYRPDEIEIEVIGTRPGEKAHEALMTAEEAERASVDERMYIVRALASEMPPAAPGEAESAPQPVLDRSEVRDLLAAADWLHPEILPSMG
jgi:FlaA1/EpsC-like NDP-sugar epimerase